MPSPSSFIGIPFVVYSCFIQGASKVDVAHVYHGSLVQNLKSIKPQKSTHGVNWVYATSDSAIAASFLVASSDFDFALIHDDNRIFCVVERYKGAFDLYKGVSGSIYKLSSQGFLSNQTTWASEVVCPKETFVVDELTIEDAYAFLLKLESAGRLKLYFYPNRPTCIPADDHDIIDKAAAWAKEFPDIKEEFLRLHPLLKDRFELAKG